MKKLLLSFLSIILMFFFLTISFGATDEQPTKSGNNLIIYYSLSGNTKTVARYIQETVGGDMVEIKTVEAYPSEFEAVVRQARQERQSNYLPPIHPIEVNLNTYETVYLGFPIWGNTIPQPIATFLSQNDLSGKTIVPFNTHDGFGIGRSRQAISDYYPDVTLLEGFEMVGADVRTGRPLVSQWLGRLGKQAVIPSPEIVHIKSVSETPIVITIGAIKLEGFLNNSAESQEFIKMMPEAVSMIGYGGREYYGRIAGRINAQHEGRLSFEDGDITYCPHNNTLAIFFAQTDRPSLTMRVIPLGKVTSDLTVFQEMGSSVNAEFELK